jgi:hypothetical protein
MDASNRLQQENINLLNAKFRLVQHPRHARPILPQYRDDYVHTLYDQMGTYVQERSGLYHTTSYQPSALAQAIPELDQPVDGSQAEISVKSKLFQHKAIGDYEKMRVSRTVHSENADM